MRSSIVPPSGAQSRVYCAWPSRRRAAELVSAPLQQLQRARPRDLEFAHVTEVENTCAGADSPMLLDDAAVLNRHFEAREVGHSRAELQMFSEQDSALRETHRHRYFTSAGSLKRDDPEDSRTAWRDCAQVASRLWISSSRTRACYYQAIHHVGDHHGWTRGQRAFDSRSKASTERAARAARRCPFADGGAGWARPSVTSIRQEQAPPRGRARM